MERCQEDGSRKKYRYKYFRFHVSMFRNNRFCGIGLCKSGGTIGASRACCSQVFAFRQVCRRSDGGLLELGAGRCTSAVGECRIAERRFFIFCRFCSCFLGKGRGQFCREVTIFILFLFFFIFERKYADRIPSVRCGALFPEPAARFVCPKYGRLMRFRGRRVPVFGRP